MSGFARGNAHRAERLCGTVPTHWRDDCAYGVARDLTSNDEGGARAARFCRVLPLHSRPRCFYGIGTILASIYVEPGKLAQTCAQLAGRYAADCTMRRSS